MARSKIGLKQRGEILELRQKYSIRKIADITGVSKTQVQRVCGPSCVNGKARNSEIKSMRQSGKTITEIASRFGLSAGRVSQICKLLSLVLVVCVIGCEFPRQVRELPAPAAEVPPVQLPVPLQQKNWRGTKGEGSCVYASLTSHARWQNKLEFADWIVSKSGGDGETQSRLMRRLTELGQTYAYTEQAKPEFLDWCHVTRRGCILWWKPSHCCTFLGYVQRDGKLFCAILDNNNVGRIELTERSQFIRAWESYGGFGLALLGDPASPLPWLSYEVLE